MKRILSLLLTVALLMSFALADGTFGFTMADYHGCAGSFLPRFGYEVAWNDVSEQVGVECLELTYTNLLNEHGVYVAADPVMAISVIYAFSITSDQDDLEGSVNEFSQLVKSAVMCAWVADNASAEDLQGQLTAALTACEDEFAELVEPLLHMDGDFTGHAEKEGFLFGYPAAFTIELDMQTFACLLTVQVTPPAPVAI